MKKTTTMTGSYLLALILMLFLSAATLFAGTGSSWSVSNISGSSFKITRTGNLEVAETVYYRTVSLSAIAGQHFTEKTGSVTFGVNEDNKTISVSETNPTSDAYKYQTGSSRTYRFEVFEPGGNVLASCTRSKTTGTNVPAAAFETKDITINAGEITVTDDNYEQAYHAVSVSTYFSQAPQAYLQFVNAQLRMTLTFQAKEKDDGYQHLQILVNNTSTCDEGSGDNNPGTLSKSTYMACFVHKGGSTNSTYSNYSFPVTSYGDSCGKVGKVWTSINSSNDVGELRQQYFKSGSRASDGRLILPNTLSTLGIRFDASGDNEDTWYAYNTVAHIQAIDSTAPTMIDSPVVSGGTYAKGQTLYVSIPFSEIVVVSGTVELSTSWGYLSYETGSGSNVLTFKGTITASAGTTLSIGSIIISNGKVKDLSGNELASGTISKSMSKTLSETATFTISYNLNEGSATNNESYTYSSSTFTLTNPIRTGYRFDGWTGSNGNTPQTTVTIPTNSFGDLTYTANWTDVWGMKTSADGGPLYPYRISTPEGLVLLAESLNSNGSFANKCFMLEDDIDMHNVTGFEIGTENNVFTGRFSANGHTISNAVFGSSTQSPVGLFRYSNGSLNDLVIDGATVEGADITGILIGESTSGFAHNCFVFNSSIKCLNSYGIISAGTTNLDNSHYRNITINGGEPVSDIFTITINDSRLKVSTAPAITYPDTPYYPENSVVTVTSANHDLYALSSITVSYGETVVNATRVDDYSYSFTMPSADVTITAVFTPVEYTITYDLDGGTINNPRTTYNCESSNYTLSKPTRTGYRFDGWTGSNGENEETTVTVSTGSYGNLSYKANWTDVWGMESGANGSEDHPYTLSDAAGLILLSKSISSSTYDQYINKHFVLTDDINLDGVSGISQIGSGSCPFKGILDANGHTIKNYYLNSSSSQATGIFGAISRATIKNIIVDNATIIGKRKVGIIAGDICYNSLNNCFIENCYIFDSSVSAESDFGVIYGRTDDTVNLTNTHFRNVTLIDSSNNNSQSVLSDIFTITCGEGISITGTQAITYKNVAYYTEDSQITVIPSHPELYYVSQVSVSYGETVDTYDADTFTMPAADVQVTAVLSPKNYTITYNLSDGTTTNPTTYNCETATFTLSDPTRTGYRFDGWTGSNGETIETTVSISTGTYGNLSYTAHWTDLWGMGSGAKGSEDHPYTISDAAGLILLSNSTKSNEFTNIHFVLSDDINLSGVSGFEKISIYNYPFEGILDASNHTISNYALGFYASTNIGLFAGIDYSGTVKNLIIEEATVIGRDNVGILAGDIWATGGRRPNISNCYVFNSSVSGETDVGIFSGTEFTTLTNCHYRNVMVNGGEPESDIYTVELIPGVTKSGNAAITYKDEDYYTAGTEITLTITDRSLNEGYILTGFTVEQKSITIDKTQVDENTYTFIMPSGDVEILGSYSPIEYSITYNLNGGSISNPRTSYNCGSADFTLVQPTRTGYIFAGWTGTDIDTPQMNVTIPCGSTGDREYTATWTDKWGVDNGADGSAEHPFIISDVEGLILLSESLTGETDDYYTGKHFSLVSDLDLKGFENRIRISDGNESMFRGVFDGNNHVISNYSFNIFEVPDAQTVEEASGLFGGLYNGTVKNLIMDNARVNGDTCGGTIAGIIISYFDNSVISRVENCYVFNSSVSADNLYYFGYIPSADHLDGSHYRESSLNNDSDSDIFTVTLESGISKSGSEVITFKGTDYYTPGTTITVTVEPRVGYKLTGIRVGDLETVKVDDYTYTFTMPWGDVSVEAVWKVEAAFAMQNLALSDQIGVRFWMDLSGLTDEEKATGVMTFSVNGSPTQTVTYAERETDTYNEVPYPVFRCKVNSIQMADTITAVFTYEKAGQTVSLTKTYSVEQYLDSFFAACDDNPNLYPSEMVDLVTALAVYGEYAQKYLSEYNGWTLGEDHTAMKDYSLIRHINHNSYFSNMEMLLPSYEYWGDIVNTDILIHFALLLDSKTSIRVYFEPVNGYSGSLTVTVDGKPVEVQPTSVYNGGYQITIEGIKPQDLDKYFTVIATTERANKTAYISLCALSYAYAVISTDWLSSEGTDTMCVLYRYYEAAHRYINYINSL